MLCAHSNGFIIKRYKKSEKTCSLKIKHFFFNCLHTFSKLWLFFFQTFTHKSKNRTHKMLIASHHLQNEVLHSKYYKHILKANICKHLWHTIHSCTICVCYIENCVLCFAKSVLWNWKLSRRLIISAWFWRFGVEFRRLSVRFQKSCDKWRYSV